MGIYNELLISLILRFMLNDTFECVHPLEILSQLIQIIGFTVIIVPIATSLNKKMHTKLEQTFHIVNISATTQQFATIK